MIITTASPSVLTAAPPWLLISLLAALLVGVSLAAWHLLAPRLAAPAATPMPATAPNASPEPLQLPLPLRQRDETTRSRFRRRLQYWHQHRQRLAIERHLPDALDYLARALRAGHGFRSALSLLSREAPAPLGPALRTATDQIQYGMPMEQALRELVTHTGSADVDFFVTAVLIQKDTGGNLAELLTTLAQLIRARARLRARIRVISAEGRASGAVLGALPVIMLLLLSMVNADYVGLLWTTDIGQALSLVALMAMLVGGLWIRSIVRVKL